MQDLSQDAEQARRKAIVAAGATDRQRWERPGSYEPFWSARAVAAAGLCNVGQWVCDIGCGMQTLRAALPAHCVYLPADLRAWTAEVERCDLNAGHLPSVSLACCDVAIMLGVLEYIYNPQACLAAVANSAQTIILSYNCVELAAYDRAAFGWVTALTADALGSTLREAGYAPEAAVRFGPAEVIIRARSLGFGVRSSLRRRLYRTGLTLGILSRQPKSLEAA